MDCIHMAQNGNRWRSLVNSGSITCGEVLDELRKC